ncbi:MAG: hypothetical protein QG628_74 [Patescibacteria group bacterium]|nr:hypothetical protein [Patescibacteria group bacterium]
MKIGFVLDDGLDSSDGVQQYVLTLGAWLSANGHSVHYIAGQTERSDIQNLHALATNIRVRFNKNRLAIPLSSSRRKIVELLDGEQFDVLHVQMPFSPQYAGRIIRLAPRTTAIVGTFHILPYASLQTIGAKLLGVASKKSLQRFNEVVSVSPAAQAFAQEAMGIQSSVIPNAVNLSTFRKGSVLPKYDDDVQTIVFLGRLVERKGCIELLQAVSHLVRAGKFNGRRLVICGAGPLQSKVDDYIHRHGLMSVVECVGRISEQDKPGYLASADLAIFPSKGGESFGIVLVEAIAAGAGVTVGGDNPGYRYVLNERTEALVDPNNTLDFANKLDELLENKTVSKTLGAMQRKDIEQFDVGRVGNQLLEVYSRSIAKATHKLNNR